MLGSSQYESRSPVEVPQAGAPEFAHRAAQLIRGYASRCAARTNSRTTDHEWSLQGGDVFCRAIPEGTLAKMRQGSSWMLFLEWSDGYGRRLLASGSRDHVERYALEAAVHGPPGGPEFCGQGTAWRTMGDDTLHALTVDGEFRLMPLGTGQHLLLFARNDRGVHVLGLGAADELKETAEQRLQHSRGRAIAFGFGKERIQLRGVGTAAVIGYIDWLDGARLLLGHLTGQRFGLLFVRGETGHCVGEYDLASLERGDLGEIFGWTAHADHVLNATPKVEEGGHVSPRMSSRAALCPVKEPRHASTQAAKSALSAADQRQLDRHLTLDTAVEGPGATVVPKLLEGLRALVRQNIPNQLLRACDVRSLLEERAGVTFSCCSKSFSRALASVAARTQILRPVGRRWEIRLGDLLLVDSELMRSIEDVAVTIADVDSPSSSTSDPGPTPD
jgi:hypothetical protein